MPSWFTGSATANSPISDDPRIAALQNGVSSTSHWQLGQPLTYSFPQAGAFFAVGYGDGEITTGWQGLTAAQQQAVRLALAEWSAVANIEFVEVADTSTNVGDLRFGFSRAVAPTTAAHSYLPVGRSPEAGDVWLSWDWRDDRLAPASTSSSTYDMDERFAYATLIHEIGHALGLYHPFDDGSLRFTDPLPLAEDTVLNTLMSYNWYDWSGELVPPSSPMPYDILAIQALYGPNMRHEAGDTVWSFDISQSGVQTIWDAGGTDTLRLTNTTNQPFPDVEGSQWSVIDLAEGAGSVIGFVNEGDYGLSNMVSGQIVRPYGLTPTVYIAHGAVIENAVGTAGPDVIYGNASNNRLDGGGDTRRDQIDGREGLDTAVYAGRLSDYQIQRATPPANPGSPTLGDIEARKEYTVTRNGTDAALSQDWLVDIERLEFSNRNVALDLERGDAANTAAAFLVALKGAGALRDITLSGEAISYADQLDTAALARMLVDAGVTAQLAGGHSDAALIQLFYQNVTGQRASQADLQWTLDFTQAQGFSQSDMLAFAVELPQIHQTADLVGLQRSGWTYLPYEL